MTLYTFYETGEMNGSSFVRIALRSSAILNTQKDDKYCFIWSILVHIHPYKFVHRNRVSICRQNFNELNIEGFDFSNGLKSSDVLKFEKLNKLTIMIFEISFYQDKQNGNTKLILIDVGKKDLNRNVDMLIYNNH